MKKRVDDKAVGLEGLSEFRCDSSWRSKGWSGDQQEGEGRLYVSIDCGGLNIGWVAVG